jgi:signal transduction histidine kinase
MVITALMLALFLFTHIAIIINVSWFFDTNTDPFKDTFIQDTVPFAFLLLSLTFTFWVFLNCVVWFLLYFVLKPVSETITSKENFIANAHHELKTPLTVINSELDLFDQQNFNQSQKTEFVGIKLQVEKMINLTNHLLAKLSKNQEILLKTQININEVVTNSLNKIHNIYKDSNLEVHINIDENATINSNDILFKQLIFSVLENAFKHTQNIHKPQLIIKYKLENKNRWQLEFANTLTIKPLSQAQNTNQNTTQDFELNGNGMRAIKAIAKQINLNIEILNRPDNQKTKQKEVKTQNPNPNHTQTQIQNLSQNQFKIVLDMN